MILFIEIMVHVFVAVFWISDNSVADAGKMGPDLMRTPGKKLNPQKGMISIGGQRFIACLNIVAARTGPFCHSDLIRIFVFDKPPFDHRLLFYPSPDKTAVVFFTFRSRIRVPYPEDRSSSFRR